MIRSLFFRAAALVLLTVLSMSPAYAQSLRVISPNGGEVWEAGTTQTVRWEASGINDEVEVEFTSDGSQWRRIARVSGSTTQVSWTVDNRPSENAKVRVITKNEDLSDESDGTFTITPDPLDQTLVLSPNGGEVLTVGQAYTIRWQLPLDAIEALLEYSTNFGMSWVTIATLPATVNQYAWTVPDIGKDPVTTAVVRVSIAEALDHFDISDQAFTIQPKSVTAGKLTVTHPNGGENFTGGSEINVTWSYVPGTGGEDEGPKVAVEYSIDKGATWVEIATEDADGGGHTWIIPNVSTTQALVRVIEIGGGLGDTSDAYFSINGTSTSTLTVLSPNGGEVWKEGEMHDITWSSQGESGMVKILLETTGPNNDVNVQELATINASANRISWAVPSLGNEPLQARIIVEANGEQDASDAPFTILPKGSLSVSNQTKSTFELQGFYPNPAHDIVTFSWAPSGKNAVVAKLYNSSGAVVRTTSVSGNSRSLSIEVRDLPQGAYFYELLTDGHIARGVLTIQR